MSHCKFTPFLALALMTISAVANAVPTLYGATYGGAPPLLSIDTATGQATSIGGSLTNVGDLTSDQLNTLWGVTIAGPNNLVTIDPTTGAFSSSVAITGVSSGAITSLAYNPISGTLYGNTTPGFGAAAGDELYTINPLTGVAALVGRIGFDNVFALAFDQAGALFGIGDTANVLISLSLVTGNGNLIAAGLGAGLFDMASDPATGTMYLSQAFGASLATIDTTTGVITSVGPYNNADASNVAGLAFLNVTVPEPGSLALIGLGLIAFRLRGWRRSR